MRLLVTRPDQDGRRTADALRARGHEVVLGPLMRIEAVPNPALGPGPWHAVAVTSFNAVRALAAHRRFPELSRYPLFAAGNRTAKSARAAGFTDVVSAEGDVAALAALLRTRMTRGERLLYLAGETRAGDLAAALAPAAIEVDTVVVYRGVAATAFAPEVAQALAGGRIDGVLHYSRRSAAAYARCAEIAGLSDAPVAHYCLSAQVSEPLAAAGIAGLRIAAAPDENALFALI
jgi:uroporphyrinogen-III synthase